LAVGRSLILVAAIILLRLRKNWIRGYAFLLRENCATS